MGTNRTTGKKIVEHLKSLGRSSKRAGVATTEELAASLGVSVGEIYSRLWWMANKDGTIVSLGGKGKSKAWRLAPRRRSAQVDQSTNEEG